MTVDKMPPQRKAIFCLSRKQGLSNDAIALQLNISKRTVETHISAALSDLRKVISILLLFFRIPTTCVFHFCSLTIYKHSEMEKNRVYNILRRLVDHTVPSEHRSVIKNWLAGSIDTPEKEAAMRQIWQEMVAEADNNTSRSLQKTLQKFIMQTINRLKYLYKVAYYAMPQSLFYH